MATFTITVSDRQNLPPDQVGNLKLTLDYDELYTFTNEDFTTNTNPQYSDPEGDEPKTLKIVTYPDNNSNQLLLNGTEVVENDEIPFTDIIGGNFSFQADTNILTEDNFSFEFTIADTGSETFSSATGTVSIAIKQRQNEPPSEVGDGTASVDDDQTLTFTETMFTATTPAYSDPEGNPPSKLKIISLPNSGEIRLNNVAVESNQIINFSDINQGRLTYVPEDVNTDTMDGFEFQIADSGSNIFVG